MRTLSRALIVAALLAAPGVSQAAGDERNGYVEIMRGDLSAAERMLDQERKIAPQDAMLDLNLAAIYARTGRTQQARALYATVLAQPNQSMLLSRDRTAWSHDLAALGLRRLGAEQVTAR